MVAQNAYASLSQGTRTHPFRVQSSYQASPRFSLRSSSPHSDSSMLQSGKVTPVTYSEVYPLERLSDGLVALENRRTWGKAVVRVKDEPAPTAKM